MALLLGTRRRGWPKVELRQVKVPEPLIHSKALKVAPSPSKTHSSVSLEFLIIGSGHYCDDE